MLYGKVCLPRRCFSNMCFREASGGISVKPAVVHVWLRLMTRARISGSLPLSCLLAAAVIALKGWIPVSIFCVFASVGRGGRGSLLWKLLIPCLCQAASTNSLPPLRYRLGYRHGLKRRNMSPYLAKSAVWRSPRCVCLHISRPRRAESVGSGREWRRLRNADENSRNAAGFR